MIYTPQNAADALVFDMATGEQIKQVLSVDTDARTVLVTEQPIRLVGDEVATLTRTFSDIGVNLHPVTCRLVSAHCYGEIVEPKP